MKLCFDKRLKDPTYYGQQGFRNGKKVTSKNIKKFGKHSELLMITNDPEAYVREKIRKWNEEHRNGRISFDITLDFNSKVSNSTNDVSKSNWLNIGYFYLQYLMKGLKLGDFFKEVVLTRKITFDCYEICRFLTYARILDPSSKYATRDKLETYYEKPKCDYHHILRFMDVLEDNHDKYLQWLYTQSNTIVPRDNSVMYYDCTNFYFECEREDEQVVDEVTGELIDGLRKYGISKEHRNTPIVEMGLFIDNHGIPVSMCLHPGNTSEQVTIIPLEKELLKMTKGKKFIYCADAGLSSYNIRKFNSMGGRAFIVTQSIKKLSKILQEAVFNDYDYRLLSNDAPISLEKMKEFDRFKEKNLNLYNEQESQIFSTLKVRLKSGRKAFSIRGANALAKVCILADKLSIEDIETPIAIDTSVEDYIKMIEEQVAKNRTDCRQETAGEGDSGAKQSHSEYRFMKEIFKMKGIGDIKF